MVLPGGRRHRRRRPLTYILVQNPTHPTANVRVDYMTPQGPVAGPSFSVSPGSRKNIYAADTINGAPSLSAVVTSDNPIIAERSMYGNGRSWGTASIGVPVPRKTWYLAEGSTGGGMETWVTVQNPNRDDVEVKLTYMTPKGARAGPTATMPPQSRSTFFVADTVPDEWEVSITVTADGPVVAERAMYGNNRAWGHESIGFAP